MSAVLHGTRCPACGRVATPPEPYGCEQCGALVGTLEPVELPAAGVVHATATVHRHHRPEPATPFTVVEVVLDDGPALGRRGGRLDQVGHQERTGTRLGGVHG